MKYECGMLRGKYRPKETTKAKRLYKRLFGKPFPKDWAIEFGFLGLTSFGGKQIFIAAENLGDSLETTIHELVHLRHPSWRHGKRFERETERLYHKLVKRY